jgi:hypothetical protein
MGNELEEKLKEKHDEYVEKRRKLTYNKLKGKGPYITANKVNRSSTSSIPEDFLLNKLPYNARLAKMSDRCIPRLTNIEQLEYLFEGLGKL